MNGFDSSIFYCFENFLNNLFKKKLVPIIEYYPNGQKRRETWYLNNKYHREDEPAYQKWYQNGQKRYEIWRLNNKLHREDGPAVQWWYQNGQKEYEVWYLNGKKHKEDGPAYQIWYENGEIEFEFWYLNDKGYRKEEWIEQLKKISSKHYEEQNMLYDIEKYNL